MGVGDQQSTLDFGSKVRTDFGSKMAIDFVERLGESAKQEEVVCHCPFCDRVKSDPHKKTMSVNVMTGKFCCFHCHEVGGASDIARHLLNWGHMLSTGKVRDTSTLLKREDIVFRPIKIRVGSLPPAVKDRVTTDLLDRNILSLEEIHDIDFCLSGTRPVKWSNRVILEADGVFFGKSHTDEKPKYLTQPNFRLAEHGYIGINELLDLEEPAILAEGVMDYLTLPKGHRLMSPGTSGLFNPLLATTSRRRRLVVVPDSDKPGCKAFLSILNKRLYGSRTKFAFVSWITGVSGGDINDLSRHYNMSSDEIYRALIDVSKDAPLTLAALRSDYEIVSSKNKGLMLAEDQKDYGKKRSTIKKDGKYTGSSQKKSSTLKWF